MVRRILAHSILSMGLALSPIFATLAQGNLIGPPMSLDALTAKADIVFKGTVIGSETIKDEARAFSSVMGFFTQETTFKIVSIVKGERPAGTLIFRHYDFDPKPPRSTYEPQYYHFLSGRTYVVFARKDENVGVFQQIEMSQTIPEHEGVLLCANDKPVMIATVQNVFWSELMAMLKSSEGSDVTYAIDQLDWMSGGGPYGYAGPFGSLSEFNRKDVLGAVRNLTTNHDSTIAQAVIGLIGSHNPYMSEKWTENWLSTVSSTKLPGFAPMDAEMENIGGKLYWSDLVAVANSKSSDATRALAISALGLTREPALQQPLEQWLSDPAPAVRSSAAVLLTDFPTLATRERLTTLAGDAAPEVRAAAAREIGFAQQVPLSDITAKLIVDRDAKVRRMAAVSLLSFSPKNEAVSAIFRANLDNKEFEPLFLNALARKNPQSYLDALAKVIEHKPNPSNWPSGEIPAYTAWEILFKDLQAQPTDQITSGKFDRYLDAMEKVGNYSSAEPRDIYAFYIQRGMTDRAKKFRLRADKAATYDLDQSFKQVDENPALYKREYGPSVGP